MPDYSKTIIYKICCNDTNIKDIYVGSTCNFTNRKYEHKGKCLNLLNRKGYRYELKLYKFIRENGGWNNWSMIELERYTECKDKREKEKYEREWYDKLEPSLNSHLPFHTKEEKSKYFIKYRKDNREKNKEDCKKNYHKNREKRIKEKKIYRENNPEKVKEQRKKYYEKNKEKIKEQKKKYYEKNKEKILKKEKTKERVNCPHCDKEMLKASLNRHIKKFCKELK